MEIPRKNSINEALTTCSNQLTDSPGYGKEDEDKYGQVCKECYYELQADYATRWEAEFGAEERARGMENPHDLSEEEDEWRRRMREYKTWRDSRDRET